MTTNLSTYQLAAWRVTGTAHDGTVNDNYCNLWLPDDLLPQELAEHIGSRLLTRCRSTVNGTITCSGDSHGHYAAYTATLLPADYDGRQEPCRSPLDLPYEAGPLGILATSRDHRDTRCRCGSYASQWADDAPHEVESEHPFIHDCWEFGVPLSMQTKADIEQGRIRSVRPAIICITDRRLRLDRLHDISIPGMRERNEVVRCFARELGMSAPEATLTYLAIRSNRVVGMLIPSEEFLWQGADIMVPEEVPDKVRSIWIANTSRGKGVVDDLMAAFHSAAETSRRHLEFARVSRRLVLNARPRDFAQRNSSITLST